MIIARFVSDKQSAISFQPSAFSGQLLAFSCWLLAVSFQLSAFSHQLLAFSCWLLEVSANKSTHWEQSGSQGRH
jgi:hypothetical protein